MTRSPILLIALSFCAPLACQQNGELGGPIKGVDDGHCDETLPQLVDRDLCSATSPARHEGEDHSTGYGATQYGREGADDECKYRVAYDVTNVIRGKDVTFTIEATDIVTYDPIQGADISIEAFLDDTHHASSSSVKTAEDPVGTYTVGPIRFDASGMWTVRFHLFKACADADPASPNGHIAFFIDVP